MKKLVLFLAVAFGAAMVSCGGSEKAAEATDSVEAVVVEEAVVEVADTIAADSAAADTTVAVAAAVAE